MIGCADLLSLEKLLLHQFKVDELKLTVRLLLDVKISKDIKRADGKAGLFPHN